MSGTQYPRDYTVSYFNGNRTEETNFQSLHRANSKANKADAHKALIVKFGRRAHSYTVKSTRLRDSF